MTPVFALSAALCSGAWGYVVYEELEARRKGRLARRRERRPRPAAAEVVAGLLSGRASLPLRVALGTAVGLLALAAGASVVLAGVLGYLATTSPLTVRRYLAERRRLMAARQVPGYLSAVTMGYLTGGSLPRAAQEASADLPAPLGEWLRLCVARVRTRQGDTFGGELWRLGEGERIRPLMRLGHIVTRAEEGSAHDETVEALSDLDQEMQVDDRLRRERAIAARQGTLTVQAGSVLLGAFYVVLSLAGDGAILSRTALGMILTGAAALFVGLAYLVASAAMRRATPAEVGR